MTTLPIASSCSANQQPAVLLDPVYDVSRWYALYTSSRHEKRVAQLLNARDVSCYLPLYSTVRQWQDRRKEVELPLFPGYVFVQISLRSRLQVLTVPGVVQIVSFDGRPSPVSDTEIDALRSGFSKRARFRPHPYLKVGSHVRVRRGPLEGMQGILVRRKDSFRLVLSVDLIMRSVAVEVDEADVEAAN
jgi:transcription antitermination factor NusG